jgi:hypothetical protein
MTNKSKMKPKIYLDMDGLLVNLFDRIAIEICDKPYKELNKEEKDQIRDHWEDHPKFLAKFGCIEELFANLEPFGKDGEITRMIVDTAVEFAGEYRICSRPASIAPGPSVAGKRRWIDTHLHIKPTETIFTSNKGNYAVSEDRNILIDDFTPYVASWRDRGGIAIKMRTEMYDSLEEARNFLRAELEGIYQNI